MKLSYQSVVIKVITLDEADVVRTSSGEGFGQDRTWEGNPWEEVFN